MYAIRSYYVLLEGLDSPDFTRLDEKGLTYTTLPLATDVEMTGHPVIRLWVSSTASTP